MRNIKFNESLNVIGLPIEAKIPEIDIIIKKENFGFNGELLLKVCLNIRNSYYVTWLQMVKFLLESRSIRNT